MRMPLTIVRARDQVGIDELSLFLSQTFKNFKIKAKSLHSVVYLFAEANTCFFGKEPRSIYEAKT